MSDTFTATERLWDPETETLAYAAGAEVPDSERSRLVGESDWLKRRNVIDPTDPRGYSLDPKTVAKRAPAKKTAARKVAKKTTGKRRGV
jgi:hypothetical protein